MVGVLSEAAARWFEKRGIDPETAARCGVFTQLHEQTGANVVVFPFLERGVAVNEKFRTHDKRFWQREGGKKTFWNHDALLDPSLAQGINRLIITEGEIDALTAIECGFPLAVSVPDGAPQKLGEGPIDPTDDKKFEYVWNCWDALAKAKAVIIATDGDAPGKVLAQELVRRLGVERCLFVEYPDGCKDLNDVLLKHGQAEVARVLNAAKPYPVKGLYGLQDYPDLPEPVAYSTGFERLDDHFRPVLGGFFVVTGVPGHGKSTFLSAVACNLAEIHGWRICVASFEMPPVPYHRNLLRQYHLAKHPNWMSAQDKAQADAWIAEHFRFISQMPGDDDQDLGIEEILDLAGAAVVRHSIKALVIDPWNEVEHKRRRDETESDYIGRAIRAIKRFARRYDVAVFVVAHPVKLGGQGKGIAKPNLYDISGSSNWYNKCDAGIVVWRDDVASSNVEITVLKPRFRAIGKPGIVHMQLNEGTGRFSEAPRELDLAS